MGIEIWFMPALIALTLNGVTTFLPKLTLKSLNILDVVVYSCFFFVLTALAIQPFYKGIEFDGPGVAIAMLTGISGTIGQLLYLFAVRSGPVTRVSMVSALYPLVSTLLAFGILREPLSTLQMVGVILGIASIMLLMRAKEETIQTMAPQKTMQWLLPSLGVLLAWGIWAFIPKIALQTLPPNSVIFYDALGNLVAIFPVFAYMKFKLQRNKRGISLTFATSLLTLISMLMFFTALQTGPVAAVATMTGMYPIITAILARIFLKEKMSPLHICALALAIVSIYLLVG